MLRLVHVAVAFAPPEKSPWQYEVVHVVPLHTGVTPPVLASVPQDMSTLPLLWLLLIGTTWHSLHWVGVANVPVLTWPT